MSDPTDHLPVHKDDFDRVYDLDDPSPYYTALRPSDYRMPAVLAGVLNAIHGQACAARGAGDALQVLDFACGYGAIGALLRHDLSMIELYTRYSERRWRPADERSFWGADAAFFGTRRVASRRFELGGVDIAGVAVKYAATMGFLDRAFHEDLVGHPPSRELASFLRGVDLVVESGSVGGVLPVAYERILDGCGNASRPWFLYGPRPDVDWAPLNALWADRGYRAESLGPRPIRYRKALAESERADMLRLTRDMGLPDEAVMRDGYLLVDMTLARPEADAGNPSIEALRGDYDRIPAPSGGEG